MGARLKFWRRSRVRLYYNGSAAKSHSTSTQYRQLRRLSVGFCLESRVECRESRVEGKLSRVVFYGFFFSFGRSP